MSIQTDRLKELLEEKRILTAPAAFDALSAKLIQKNNFDIVWVSGASLTNAFLGNADVGMISYGEVKGVVHNIMTAVDMPIIIDVDTGYGGVLNTYRMTKEFETMGVAGIQIEDQSFPKRCAYFSGVNVVDVKEMASRLNAVLKARENKDFLIIARTDAGKSLGFKEAMRRAKLYYEMGADMLFISAPESEEELNEMVKSGIPFCTAIVEGTATENLNMLELEKMGFKIAKYPQTLIRASMKGMENALKDLKDTGTVSETKGFVVTSKQRNELTDLSMFTNLEKEFNE
jgi:methylisocitrate lyase